MKEVTITGFTPTFDFDYFEALHRRFTGAVIRGEGSIENAVASARSSSYDPTTVYNALEPLLAARDADRRALTLRIGAWVVGAIGGGATPYFLTDDPSGFPVVVSAVVGAVALGLPTLAFTDAAHDENPGHEYDLAYDHIGAVVSALVEKYNLHKPNAEVLFPEEGYKTYHKREIIPSSHGRKVTTTERFVLQHKGNTFDLQIVNAVPDKIKISEEQGGITELEFSSLRTPIRFTYRDINRIRLPQAAVEKYQAAIEKYGIVDITRHYC